MYSVRRRIFYQKRSAPDARCRIEHSSLCRLGFNGDSEVRGALVELRLIVMTESAQVCCEFDPELDFVRKCQRKNGTPPQSGGLPSRWRHGPNRPLLIILNKDGPPSFHAVLSHTVEDANVSVFAQG